MGRCWSCCQENCGFGPCSCPCHKGEGNDEYRVQPTEPVKLNEPLATFYMVRNSKGEYYRTYAQGGRRSGWVNDLKDGRLWTTSGPARGKITALANERPNNPVPELVEFVVTEVKVVDQKARVAEARVKKEREAAERAAAQKRQQLEDTQKEIARLEAKVAKLKGTTVNRGHGSDCGCKSCVGM